MKKKGSRRQQFVSEEMGNVELKEGAPLIGIRSSIIDGSERISSCNNEKKNERSLVVLTSDIAYDNHGFPVRECDGEKSRAEEGLSATQSPAPV
jgi:hypothetical protein